MRLLRVPSPAANIQAAVTHLSVVTADISPPEFRAGFPGVQDVAGTSFGVRVSLNEAAVCYAVALHAGAEAPASPTPATAADASPADGSPTSPPPPEPHGPGGSFCGCHHLQRGGPCQPLRR